MEYRYSVTALMMKIDNPWKHAWYYRLEHTLARAPGPWLPPEKVDVTAKLILNDPDNVKFLTYEEIDHEQLMRYYVRHFVYDKEQRKTLFDILRRHDYIHPFMEKLVEYDLEGDYEDFAVDIYDQIFDEWIEKHHIDTTEPIHVAL